MFCRFGRLSDRQMVGEPAEPTAASTSSATGRSNSSATAHFISYKNNNFFIKNAVFCIFVSPVLKR